MFAATHVDPLGIFHAPSLRAPSGPLVSLAFRAMPIGLRDLTLDAQQDAPASGGDPSVLTVDEALKRLSIPDALVRRRNVQAAIQFLTKACGHPPEKIVSYLRAMDLSKEVKVITIPKGRILIGYKDPGHSRKEVNMFGEFFTRPGANPFNLGIAVKDQHFVKYIVKSDTEALMSTTGAFQHESQGSGGGVQFIIPWKVAGENLSIAHVSATRTGKGRAR